jgi:uncharacterized protein (DUF433 family)
MIAQQPAWAGPGIFRNHYSCALYRILFAFVKKIFALDSLFRFFLRSLLMAALDWSQCPAVESVPGKVSGAWVFRGTRMPVATVFENLEAGASIDDIIEWFDVTREQVTEVLNFAARSLEASGRQQ